MLPAGLSNVIHMNKENKMCMSNIMWCMYMYISFAVIFSKFHLLKYYFCYQSVISCSFYLKFGREVDSYIAYGAILIVST